MPHDSARYLAKFGGLNPQAEIELGKYQPKIDAKIEMDDAKVQLSNCLTQAPN